jgi:large subunit ribosomal protein L15
VGDLEKMENIEEINPDVLYDHGYAHKRKPIKILGQGEVKKKLSVAAHAFSQTAKTKIESAGGRTSVL